MSRPGFWESTRRHSDGAIPCRLDERAFGFIQQEVPMANDAPTTSGSGKALADDYVNALIADDDEIASRRR